MKPIVAVIAAGMMGSGVAGRLSANGIAVRTSLAGRSVPTRKRAEAAGMADATDQEIAGCDIILSIVPPGEALRLSGWPRVCKRRPGSRSMPTAMRSTPQPCGKSPA